MMQKMADWRLNQAKKGRSAVIKRVATPERLKKRPKIKGPLTAIRAMCLECVCWQPEEVRECSDRLCPLYRYRMGRRGRSIPES